MVEVNDEMRLAAENARLRLDIDRVSEMLPALTPYVGAVPKTMEALSELPRPWQRQVLREHPELMKDLRNRQVLDAAISAHDAEKGRIAAVLASSPVKTKAELDALPRRERREVMSKLTSEQMLALGGVAPQDKTGYL